MLTRDRFIPGRLRRLFEKNSLAGGIGMLAGGTAAGQAIALVSIPILSRLYSPEDFGVLAVYASLLAGLVVVITLRYETAIPVAEDSRGAAHLLVLSLATSAAVAGIAALGVGLLGSSISRWANTPQIRSYLWLIPVSGFAAGLYQSFNFWAIRRKEYGRIALTKVTQNVWMVGTQIAVGIMWKGPVGLLVGDSFKWAGGSGRLAAATWREEAALLKGVRWEGMMEQARRYRKFPLLSAPSSLANTLGQQFPALIIAGFYGPYVAGSFYLVQKILAVPVTFLGRSISDAYIGEFSQLLRHDRAGAARLYYKMARTLLLVGVLPTIALVLGGGVVTRWVLGAEWSDAGTYLQIVALMFLAKFVVNPLSHTLVLMQRQGVQLVWDVGRMLVVNGAILVVALGGLAPVAAIWAYSLSMFVAYVLLYVLCVRSLAEHAAPALSGLSGELPAGINADP